MYNDLINVITKRLHFHNNMWPYTNIDQLIQTPFMIWNLFLQATRLKLLLLGRLTFCNMRVCIEWRKHLKKEGCKVQGKLRKLLMISVDHVNIDYSENSMERNEDIRMEKLSE